MLFGSNRKKSSTKKKTRRAGVQNDLAQIRRGIQYKLRNRVRLNPVEVHILRNFAALENKMFRPSLARISTQIFGSLVRPSAKLALPGVLLFGAFGSFTPLDFNENQRIAIVGENIANAATPVAPKENVNITELALAMGSGPEEIAAPDQLADVSAIDFDSVTDLSKLNLGENLLAPKGTEQVSLARQIAEDADGLGEQRNLVKFLSGLIAAYRPSIGDCGTIAKHIVESASKEKVDPFYIAAVIAIESRFHSGAQSSVGAMGLMQLMPTTAREVAGKRVPLVDPRTNIALGISYLKQLEQKYKGNRFLALAAYNWGPANVDRVGGRRGGIPASVRNYSTVVLERTASWQRHFSKATQVADSLQAEVASSSSKTS